MNRNNILAQFGIGNGGILPVQFGADGVSLDK